MTVTATRSTARAGQQREWIRWCLPLAVALAIFVATSWPRPVVLPGNSDKVVHLTSYAVLAASVAWASRSRRWTRALIGVACISAVGAADEWHQQFIPGRRMDVRDWLADTAGAVLGFSLVTALARRREFVA